MPRRDLPGEAPVTDDKGATGTLTKDVVVTVPVNQAPTAAFGSSCSGATCGFDATASSDSGRDHRVLRVGLR